jgi:hypothetical protein
MLSILHAQKESYMKRLPKTYELDATSYYTVKRGLKVRLNKLLSNQCAVFLKCQSSMHMSTSRKRENGRARWCEDTPTCIQ